MISKQDIIDAGLNYFKLNVFSTFSLKDFKKKELISSSIFFKFFLNEDDFLYNLAKAYIDKIIEENPNYKSKIIIKRLEYFCYGFLYRVANEQERIQLLLKNKNFKDYANIIFENFKKVFLLEINSPYIHYCHEIIPSSILITSHIYILKIVLNYFLLKNTSFSYFSIKRIYKSIIIKNKTK